MRIISGEARGRHLRAPRGDATRPTADRVRQALYDVLGSPAGLVVLDLFAGTGALGLEALSRGASRAVFVDEAEPAIRVVRDNVKTLGYEDRARILRLEVRRALRLLEKESAGFDWVFLDPPYASAGGDTTLAALGASALVRPGGLVIAEHDRRRPPAERYGALALDDRRRWGQTEVSLYAVAPGGVTAPPAGSGPDTELLP
ncbi:MAG TPA: 16S rRNA (guanine(966)-N(2))-methyltransferase RsmD [Polyangia bacterium]|jgi:16S rRNA (guanine966-N2)-methyltransferase